MAMAPLPVPISATVIASSSSGQSQRFFQQELRLGPRDEHRWRDLQLEVVEALDPGDIGDRLSRSPSLHSRLKCAKLRFVKFVFTVGEKEGAVTLERMGEQDLRIEIGGSSSAPIPGLRIAALRGRSS